MPRVIQVIESDTTRGKGVQNDPARVVVQYHTLDGDLLAERDRWAEELAAQNAKTVEAWPRTIAEERAKVVEAQREIEALRGQVAELEHAVNR